MLVVNHRHLLAWLTILIKHINHTNSFSISLDFCLLLFHNLLTSRTHHRVFHLLNRHRGPLRIGTLLNEHRPFPSLPSLTRLFYLASQSAQATHALTLRKVMPPSQIILNNLMEIGALLNGWGLLQLGRGEERGSRRSNEEWGRGGTLQLIGSISSPAINRLCCYIPWKVFLHEIWKHTIVNGLLFSKIFN